MTEEDKRMLEFLSYVEDNYYFNSGGWVNCQTDKWTTKEEILKEFKHLYGG
jgi:hypothetical protein